MALLPEMGDVATSVTTRVSLARCWVFPLQLRRKLTALVGRRGRVRPSVSCLGTVSPEAGYRFLAIRDCRSGDSSACGPRALGVTRSARSTGTRCGGIRMATSLDARCGGHCGCQSLNACVAFSGLEGNAGDDSPCPGDANKDGGEKVRVQGSSVARNLCGITWRRLPPLPRAPHPHPRGCKAVTWDRSPPARQPRQHPPIACPGRWRRPCGQWCPA